MVVGLWALVLLPSWLRTHEQADEGRQVDRFRRAMTHLSTSRIEVAMQAEHKVVQAKRAPRAGAGSEAQRPVSAAERRRRVLIALSALEVAGIGAWALGAGSAPAVFPLLLIASFLTLARTQVRAERARRAANRPTATAVSDVMLAQVPNRRHQPQVSTGMARTADALHGMRRAIRQRSGVVEQAPAAPTAEAPSGWQPVRTPAPSYVSAPAATAVPRAIDAFGGWTGTAMVEAARAETARADAVRADVVSTDTTGHSRRVDHMATAAMAEQPTDRMPVVSGAASTDTDHTAEIPVVRITA